MSTQVLTQTLSKSVSSLVMVHSMFMHWGVCKTAAPVQRFEVAPVAHAWVQSVTSCAWQKLDDSHSQFCLSMQICEMHLHVQVGLSEKIKAGGAQVPKKVIEAPFVQIPLGVTEDRLVGTVDIEASMKVLILPACRLTLLLVAVYTELC